MIQPPSVKTWSGFSPSEQKYAHQAGEIVSGFALQLGGVPKPTDEPRRKCKRPEFSRGDETYSTFDSRCSGFAFKTTKIKMGRNASAPSSLCRCLNRPKYWEKKTEEIRKQ